MTAPSTFDDILDNESKLMGRPVTYRNAWECMFRKHGQDHRFTVIIYDVEPTETKGFRMEQTRWVVVVDGGDKTGGIVTSDIEPVD